MDRPSCPGTPCWPGIPRSPWEAKISKRLNIHFILDFSLTTGVLPKTGEDSFLWLKVGLIWHKSSAGMICSRINGTAAPTPLTRKFCTTVG